MGFASASEDDALKPLEHCHLIRGERDVEGFLEIRQCEVEQVGLAALPAGWIADCGEWSDFLSGCGFGIDNLSVSAAAVGSVVVAKFEAVNFRCHIVKDVTRKRLQKVAQVGFAERSDLQEFFRIEDCH